MKIAFIVKSTVKNKKRFYRNLKSSFREEEYECFETEKAQHAIELAINATKNFQYIISVGGDGTLHEVVNGVMQSGNHEKVILGCLNYGTANDFLKTINSDGTIRQLRNWIKGKRIHKIDVGRCYYYGLNDTRESRYFLNIADIGIGGEVVEKVNSIESKFLSPKMIYFRTILQCFLTYENTLVRCKSKDWEWEGKIISMAFANGKFFGSGLGIAPHSNLKSDKLAVTILGDVTIKDFVMNFGKLYKAKKVPHKEAHYLELDYIEIDPVQYSCAIDLDGEFVGYAPAKFEIVKEKINFLFE